MEEILRSATKNDMLLLYQWVNDPEVRRNSFCQEPITYQEHVVWFEHCMENRNIRVYIYVVDGCPVGQIRMKRENDIVWLSYSICKNYRGKGYAVRMLRLASNQALKVFPDAQSILAEVKMDNCGSRKALLRARYNERCVEYEMKLTTDSCNLGGILDELWYHIVNKMCNLKYNGYVLPSI